MVTNRGSRIGIVGAILAGALACGPGKGGDDGSGSTGEDGTSGDGGDTGGGGNDGGSEGGSDDDDGGGDSGGDTDDGGGDGGGEPYPNCLPALVDMGTDVCEQGMMVMGDVPEDPDLCMACLCSTSCTTDADCAPETGNATGACDNEHNECVLTCDGGETCPDGMACIEAFEGKQCMWATGDEFVCFAEGGIQPCEGIEDEAECNAKASPDGYGKCLWSDSGLYDDNTCVAAGTLGECLLLRPFDEGCANETSCGDQGPLVFWQDLGAGTNSLVILDGCDWFLDESVGYERCDFSGNVGIPLLCDCGCG